MGSYGRARDQLVLVGFSYMSGVTRVKEAMLVLVTKSLRAAEHVKTLAHS